LGAVAIGDEAEACQGFCAVGVRTAGATKSSDFTIEIYACKFHGTICAIDRFAAVANAAVVLLFTLTNAEIGLLAIGNTR
jgi:hypothetical protein